MFWLLTVLLEEILPADYYAKDLSGTVFRGAFVPGFVPKKRRIYSRYMRLY